MPVLANKNYLKKGEWKNDKRTDERNYERSNAGCRRQDYDDVIEDMESCFGKLKKSEISIPLIKEVGDMSFEYTVDKIIEKWADYNENTAEEINDKNVLVMQFAELPLHYSYVIALFSSEE